MWRIDNMVEYLNNFPPFGAGQGLLEDDILKLVDFLPPKEWQKELIIKGFDSAKKGITDIVKFCERLKTTEEIFQTQGERNHQNNKTNQSGERHQPAKLEHSKGLYQAANPS